MRCPWFPCFSRVPLGLRSRSYSGGVGCPVRRFSSLLIAEVPRSTGGCPCSFCSRTSFPCPCHPSNSLRCHGQRNFVRALSHGQTYFVRATPVRRAPSFIPAADGLLKRRQYPFSLMTATIFCTNTTRLSSRLISLPISSTSSAALWLGKRDRS
jgi:hypothetical protein